MSSLSLFFYMFSLVALVSSFLVVTLKNPVHSVLFLILTFFNCSALFVLLGAEFLAMLLLLVYVGAVAVLFLFVVNIDFSTLRKGMSKNAPLGILVGLILLIEIIISITGYNFSETSNVERNITAINPSVENTKALGLVLYTEYSYLFQCAGYILLVAMIGAIALTHRKRDNVRRQRVNKQVLKDRKDSIEIKKVDIGKGTKI